jgi:glucokinase
MPRYLGLDIGGTNIKTAIIADDDGHGPPGSRIAPAVVDTQTFATDGQAGPSAVVDQVCRIGHRIAAQFGGVRAAAVTLPGTFDPATGRAKVVPNLPGAWTGTPVRGPVAAALGVPTTLVNDARAFALAESLVGAARGLRTVVCVVLGTGVGGGVVIDGRLHGGVSGMAGEIGHQTVQADGPVCGCGNRGCAEALTSAAAFSRLGDRENPEQVYAAARAGDPVAQAAIEHIVRWLGIALANAHMLLAPDAFVVGGGIARAGDLLLRPLEREVRRRMTLDEPEHVRVLPAQLGPSAGAIGAALRARAAVLDAADGRSGTTGVPAAWPAPPTVNTASMT